jgi:hypothetical protein
MCNRTKKMDHRAALSGAASRKPQNFKMVIVKSPSAGAQRPTVASGMERVNSGKM